MKVPLTNSIVNKYLIGLTFWVSVYERQKLIENFFLGCLSTHLMTHLLPQIHFEKNFQLATKMIWEWEKRQLISY